jgi:hypothetical protein
MNKVLNSKGHLVAVIVEETKTIIIARRGCETHITLDRDGNITVVNIVTQEKRQ